MYNTINIHHTTLNDCLNTGTEYLDAFFFSLDIIEESSKTDLLSLDQVQSLVRGKRELYDVKHPAAKAILAEFKDDASQNLVFHSLFSPAPPQLVEVVEGRKEVWLATCLKKRKKKIKN